MHNMCIILLMYTYLMYGYYVCMCEFIFIRVVTGYTLGPGLLCSEFYLLCFFALLKNQAHYLAFNNYHDYA